MFHPYAQLYMIPYMVSYSPNIIVVNANEYHVEWRVYLILGTIQYIMHEDFEDL